MSDYLDEELAASSRTRLERHVDECEECRGVLTGLQRVLGRLRGMPPPAARPDRHALAARVRDRLSGSRQG